MSTDWLPGSRRDQLSLARNWLDMVSPQAIERDIPLDELTMFQSQVNTCTCLLAQTGSPRCQQNVRTNCKNAFDYLTSNMRKWHKLYVNRRSA
jgi:hypothetical protein